MDDRIRQRLLARVISAAVPDLRRMLEHYELHPTPRNPELVSRLAEFLDPLIEVRLREPHPFPKHSECFDCDYRSSHLQFEDGEWHSHCTVCMEPWPCPEAGELDKDAVKACSEKAEALEAKPDRTLDEEYDLWSLRRRLQSMAQ